MTKAREQQKYAVDKWSDSSCLNHTAPSGWCDRGAHAASISRALTGRNLPELPEVRRASSHMRPLTAAGIPSPSRPPGRRAPVLTPPHE